jgi:hypothetical protein
MAKNYAGLTGGDIVTSVRRHNTWVLISRAFLIVFIAVMLVAGTRYFWRNGHWLYLVLGIALALLLFYLCIEAVGKAAGTLKNVARARVFRKFGSPDALAMRISEGVPLLESSKTLLTDSFIMKHGDFESFVPFEDILLIYRKTHSTNGVQDGVFLTVYDAYGDCFDYPFRLGKKHESEMENAFAVIMQRADRARVGYDKANLEYAKQNAAEPERE